MNNLIIYIYVYLSLVDSAARAAKSQDTYTTCVSSATRAGSLKRGTYAESYHQSLYGHKSETNTNNIINNVLYNITSHH